MILKHKSAHFRQTGRPASRHRILLCLLFIVFPLILPACFPGFSASAYDESEQASIQGSVETFLRNYTAEAMLYEDRSQAVASISDPNTAELWGTGQQTFKISGKDKTLRELQENITFVEKKAAFYSAARRMQGIYRENLQLDYVYPTFKIDGNVCHLSVKETASFRYTDSEQNSIYETTYIVDLVKLGSQWLVADITDESRFDGLYKKDPNFDVAAALTEFETSLHTEACSISNPYNASAAAEGGSNRIYYQGANAAAYAYTYARQSADMSRDEFYNSQFKSYAGQGGDCMNFVSQCMWAGFGGNQTESAITENHPPMDTDGDSRWYSYGSASGKEDALAWVSCQSFRKYLTGEKDGTGTGGSNAANDMGMYATIIDVGSGSPVTGVPVESLVGAAAHVEGAGGSYAHAIIFTAAVGTSRSEIWFCCHTKDLTHVKLGDYYFGPIKVYIPRYIRTAAQRTVAIEADRLPPVRAASSAAVGFRTTGAPADLTLTITSPSGKTEHPLLFPNTNTCSAAYTFSEPGLYKVDCGASPVGSNETVQMTFYIRCYGEQDKSPVPVEPPVDSEPPGWLFA